MENQNNLQQKVKELIRSGRTDQVFAILRSAQLSAKQRNALTIIESEYQEIKQAELKGISSTEDLQIRKNKINNRLLNLLDSAPAVQSNKFSFFTKIAIALIGGLLLCGLLWRSVSNEAICPSYPSGIKNKIIVFPFENIGSSPAKPHVSLYKRINALTAKNDISAQAELSLQTEQHLSDTQILQLGKECNADLLVWGTYSSRADSLRVVLEYQFTKKPNTQNSSQLITLKDVTGLQKGTMVKTLDDAILSLCGVIALREGDTALATKWFKKVKNKEVLDKELLNALE